MNLSLRRFVNHRWAVLVITFLSITIFLLSLFGLLNIAKADSSPAILSLTLLDTVEAETPIDITVTVYDSFGDINSNYSGMISFTSSDDQANLPDGELYNLALELTANNVSASSQYNSSYGPLKALDGNPSTDWATSGETDGAWIRLDFEQTVVVDGAMLRDRPNLTDRIHYSHLEFSDGSSITVGSLPNDGSPKAVNFSPRAIDWVRYYIDDGSGLNVGLSEFEVYSNRYTFTSGPGEDNGVHTFFGGITFNTPGIHTVTVRDALLPTLVATATVTITESIPADHLTLDLPDTLLLHETADVTITAHEISGNVDNNYKGFIRFSSSDVDAVLPNHEGTNLSPELSPDRVTASSQYNSSYSPSKATDGNSSSEWASNGQTSGAWINLALYEPTNIDKVVLRDRFNSIDQISQSHLEFSDGSSIDVGSLPNNGDPKTITFEPREVSWVRYHIDVGAGQNVGLSEFQVFYTSGYQFTVGPGQDNGTHTFFEGVTFNSPGVHTVTVQDLNDPELNISKVITVAVESSSSLELNVDLSESIAVLGQPVDAIITAQLADGTLAPSYTGTVQFSSTDSLAILPENYTFTYGAGMDNGRHTFLDGLVFNTLGQQVVTVTDIISPSLVATTTVDVHGSGPAVSLHATISPTTAFAGDPVLKLIVEARDAYGNIATGYRGRVEFVESALSTLPDYKPPIGPNQPDYTFTATNAGRAEFTFTFYEGGSQNVRVYDFDNSSLDVTSNNVTVKEVYFVVSITPDTGIRNGQIFTLIIEAQDENGEIWTGYRGGVEFSPKGISTLPDNKPPCCGNYVDYAFTAADAGRAELAFKFTENGAHAITVRDFVHPSYRWGNSNVVTVTDPPEPTPAPADPVPSPYVVPITLTLSLPPTIPYHWGLPFVAYEDFLGSNSWRGYPDHAIPTSEGALYLVAGFAHWRSAGPLSTSFQVCPYLGWENPLTDERASGGGLDGGPGGSNKHPSTIGFGLAYCSAYSDEALPLGFAISDPAPANAEGVHLDLHGGGNSAGYVLMGANADFSGDQCDAPQETVSVGDPIDTRSGAFYMNEQDLGVQTGCQNLSLHFERSYSSIGVASSIFGQGWTHNYNQKIVTLNNGYVVVQRPQGGFLLFQDVGGDIYATRPGAQNTLVKLPGGGWALVGNDRSADIFDAEGRLAAQQDPNGNLIWLTYETYDRGGQTGTRLARVDAAGGRYIWFGYDYYEPTVLTQVADNAGRTVRYTYNNFGFLETVTDVSGGLTTYVYDGLLLTSQIDPLTNVVFDNVYDDGGRVITQINNLGQHLSLAYIATTDGITTTVTDENTGAATIYEYGADGLLRQVTNPLGAVTKYRNYTDTRVASEVEDALGNITQIEYDSRGLPITITDALSNTVQISYDEWFNPAIITDTLGYTTQFTYDGPNLVEIMNAAGQTVEFEFADQAGWLQMLTTITNQAGITTTMTYDGAGDLIQVSEPLGGNTFFEYDSIGRVISTTDALNYTSTFVYDEADRLVSVTDPLTGTVSYDYDAVGNLIRVEDQEGSVITTTYSAAGLPLTLTDSLSNSVQIEYDTSGRPITTTNQLEHESVISYDLVGRPLTVTNALGDKTWFQYDLLGNVTSITDGRGNALSIEYDALSRPVTVTNALNQALIYTYDAAGNVIAIEDAAGETVSIEYDNLNRPVTITNQLGITSTLAYNEVGLVTLATDENGVITKYEYDPRNRLTEVVNNYLPGIPANADTNVTTSYEYDAVGNLVGITDSRQLETTFTYDPLGRMLSVTDALNRTMSYEYDLRGLLTAWNKADESQVSYTYNEVGWLTQITAPDRSTSFVYDEAGRRIGMGDAEGYTDYELDALGRPITITLTTGETVGYRYDAAGNRTRLIYPNMNEVQYEYNEANQLVKVIDWDLQETTYNYDEVGRPVEIVLPNGITTTMDYDAAGNLLSLTHETITGTVASYSYTYDDAGRRLTATEIGQVSEYTYDALYRLTDVLESSGDVYHYEYDAAGNRVLKVEPGVNESATYDAANQLLTLGGVAVQHDDNGNLTFDGEFTYTYNSLDQLISVSNGITGTVYGYNGDGDRLWQRVDGITTTFTLDLSGALAQVLAQTPQTVEGVPTYFVPGTGGQQTLGVWSYLHVDGLGSVRQITDAAGGVVGEMRYSPFGEIEAMSGLPAMFGYTGEQQGGSNSLVYLRARYYNPALGRFLTQDSLIPDVTNGQSLNAYAYVYNDPINLVDPSGNIPISPLPRIDGNDIRNFSQGVLDFLSWYQSKPDSCDCNEGNGPFWSWFWGPVGGATAQGVNGYVTKPAERYGTKVVETLVSRQVERSISLQSLRNSRAMRSFPIMRALMPDKIRLGTKTVSSWEVTQTVSGTLEELAEPGIPRANGTHYSGNRRVTLNTRTRAKPGPMGFAGAAAWAAWIDGISQLIADQGLCLSPMERANRFAVSLVLGLAGGTAAGLAFAATVTLTVGAPLLVATAAPVLVGLAVGYGFGIVNNKLKNVWFEEHPQYY